MYLQKNELVSVVVEGIKSLDGDSLPEINTYFTTTMSPMYSSVLRVSQEIGSYLDGIGEDIINQLILKYSHEAEMLTSCDITDSKWKFLTSNWVTFKTAIDILYNSRTYLGESSGKVYKKLGDFSISKDNSKSDSSGPVSSKIRKLECELFKLEVAVKFCMDPLLTCEDMDKTDLMKKQRSKMVVKGEYDPNRPLFGRGMVLKGNYPGIRDWEGQYYRRRYYSDQPNPKKRY